MIKEMVCICCPRGCHLKVDTEARTVEGNFCPRGQAYGISEITHPERTLTTTIKVEGGEIARVSCKTDKPIGKELLFKAMEVVNACSVKAPVAIGQVLIENLLGTGSNIIATKEVLANHA